MKMSLVLTGLLLLTSAPAVSQTPQEITTTCATLARMTEQALRQGERFEVVMYVQTAAAIRSRLGNVTACEGNYFAAVVAANRRTLESATSVIAINFVQPVPGWKHHEIRDLIRATEQESLSDLLGSIQFDINRPQDLKRQIERNGGRLNPDRPD